MKYFKVFWGFLKNSLMSQLEYRFQIIGWAFSSLLSVSMILISIGLVFSKAGTVAGWTTDEAFLVAYIHMTFFGLFWIVVGVSLVNFAQSIFTGDFDGLLLKPINTRFLVTFGGIDTNQIARLLGGLGLLIWWVTSHGVSPIILVGFLTEFIMVLFSIYSLFFLVASSSIFFVQMQNFGDLMNNIMNIGRMPAEIFSGGLRIVFFYIIPVAFIATFPARMLLGRGSAVDVVILLVITLITFFLSQLVWNFALKRYSSASS